MRHFGSRRRTKKHYTTAVIHVPSTMGSSPGSLVGIAYIIASPSIFAAGSASSNIEAQDKDRTVNVGHHIGRITIDFGVSAATFDGTCEFAITKVLRADSTPALGTHPLPSAAEISSQGLQQAVRLANPGLVFHFSKVAMTKEMTKVVRITVSPAKYKQSKMKAGDHWVLIAFNRSGGACAWDFECRYKEFG